MILILNLIFYFELYKIKNSFEVMTKQYEKEFSEEKNKIINDLEKKYLRIIEEGKQSHWLFELDGELLQSGYIKEDRKYRI